MNTTNVLLIIQSIVWLLLPAAMAAEHLISPAATPNATGPGPFIFTRAEAPSIRYQEVHSRIDFMNAGGPVLLISEISYSAPSWSGREPIDLILPNIQIRLSTTPRDPDALSVSFAENVGSDEKIVYSGPLHFYETEQEIYDIHIPIVPFAYDPSLENLLLDISNLSPISSRVNPDWTLNVALRFGDSVSNVSGGGNDSAGFLSTAGLMTRFTYTPVPEPSTWALLAIGLVSFGVAASKRKRG